MQAPTDASTASPGELVRAARVKAGLSREKLAVLADVSMSTVVRLERSDQLPNAHALVRIAAGVGIAAADLLPHPEAAAASA